MALPSTAVLEVRPTVGSDTACGGGFDPGVVSPGTDYSQQNSAQYTFTDLVSISSLVVASASHNFVAADVGNFMQITAGTGFTTGFYVIVSVAANQATLHQSPGTVGVGGTYFVGGALATISEAYSIAPPSGTIYVKASGTYTVAATLTLTGANELPMQFIGYTSTRGDGGKVTWTTAANSTTLVKFGSPGYNWVFQNFAFTNTAGTSATCFDGGLSGQSFGLRLSNCSFSGFTLAIALGYVSGVHFNLSRLVMDSCTVTACSSHGVNCSGGAHLIACYIFGNGGDGVHGTVTQSGQNMPNAIHIERCAIWGNTGDGVSNEFGNGLSSANSSWLEISSSAIGANGSHGIELAGSTGGANSQALTITDSVIESNGAYGIKNDASGGTGIGVPLLLNNAFRANTSGNYNGPGVAAQPSDITLSAEPFTNPGSGDFSLNSAAGGGALLKQAGFPTAIGA